MFEGSRAGRSGTAPEADCPEPGPSALVASPATMPPAIRKIAKKYLRDPQEIAVKGKTTTGTNTRQRYLQVMGSHKMEAMTRILEVGDYDGVIVFVRTKAATEEVADRLKARGYAAAAINGDIPQNMRERTVEALREGKIDVLERKNAGEALADAGHFDGRCGQLRCSRGVRLHRESSERDRGKWPG